MWVDGAVGVGVGVGVGEVDLCLCWSWLRSLSVALGSVTCVRLQCSVEPS